VLVIAEAAKLCPGAGTKVGCCRKLESPDRAIACKPAKINVFSVHSHKDNGRSPMHTVV